MKLGDLCTKIGSGATPRGGKDVYTNEGIAFVRSQNVYNDRFDRDGLAFIDQAAARALDGVAVEPLDVLLNITGESVGRCCLAPPDLGPARVSQHVMIVRPNKDRVDSAFLRYWLVSAAIQGLLAGMSAAGATRRALTKGMIEGIHTDFPPLPEQRRIAAILGALDDKIELNRKMNRTLEEMAQALFKSWFIDFDGHDDLVDSEIGLVPRGWGVATVSALADIHATSVHPARAEHDVWEHYSLPAFDASRSPAMELGTAIKSNKFSVPAACVLVSKLNPHIPRVWLPAVKDELRAVCSTEFVPLVPKVSAVRSFLYRFFASDAGLQAVAARVGGTTGSHQRVKPGDLLSLPCVVPPSHALQAFDEVVRPLHARMQANIDESGTLATLRDTLLPKLISGELRVPEAEAAVSEAL